MTYILEAAAKAAASEALRYTVLAGELTLRVLEPLLGTLIVIHLLYSGKQ